jgi:hypothetical protein
MKPKNYFFICIVALIAGCSSNKYSQSSSADQKLLESAKFVEPLVKGKLTINGDNVDVDIILMVTLQNYKYGGEHVEIEVPNTEVPGTKLKGIVFNYFNVANTVDRAGSSKYPISIKYSFKNTFGWKENDLIRVMYLNENTPLEFNALKPYFQARLDKFGERELVLNTEYNYFNCYWNYLNPNNIIAPCEPNLKSKPRFTKDDGMLTLKKL